MATYPDYKLKREALEKAQNLLGVLRRYYKLSKEMQALLKLYTDNHDAYFHTAVNYTYDSTQRTEINQMFLLINSLVTDWETNHINALDIINVPDTGE